MSDNSSENSTIKSEGGGDVTAKYSRLAAEYSKVRGQNTVLKKAIIEEQNKNAQLNEIIREKDQTVRKSSQEIESLNFRNSQLLRRVTVLQEEIDLLNKNGKKKTKNTNDFSNGVVDNPLLEDDMKKTIIENAKLISKLNDEEEKHEEKIASLMGQISSLNDEINKKNVIVQQMRMEYELTVDQFHKEQQDLQRDYVNNVNKLKETKTELSTLKSIYKQYINDVGPKLDSVYHVMEKKIPFLDEENPELNLLNVKHLQNRLDDTTSTELLQKYLHELILICYNIINNVTFELKQLAFSELKIYLKMLLKEKDGILSNEELYACHHLLENIGLECYDPDSVEEVVKKFMQQFLNLCSAVHSSYFHRCPSVSASSNEEAFSLPQAVETFKSSVKEVFDKVVNLPNFQQDLIREEFVKLNAALDNLIAETENVDLKRSRSSIANVNDSRNYKSTASKYLRSLLKDKLEFIPYQEAMDSKKRLQELIMLNNSLSSELKNLEVVIVKLEQEKTHLLNQCEVLRIKLENKFQPSPGTSNEPVVEVTNELGKFVPVENLSTEILARENEIQSHMMTKLDEVVIMKEAASSKARSYLLECKTLQRRLENNVVEKQLLENKYLESNRTSLELREELSTVSQNYEVQLSMMSDHLASVNEKLAQQSEDIDNLKYQLNNKMLKKGKPK